MVHSHVRAFYSWVERHSAVWDRIHVSGIAIKTAAGWAAIWLKVELSDRPLLSPLAAPTIETSDVLAFHVTIGFAELRILYRSLLRGVIGQELLESLGRPILVQAPIGNPFRHFSGRPFIPPAYSGLLPGWPRWEATVSGDNIRSLFGSDREAFDRLSRMSQTFLARNGRNDSDVARELDICQYPIPFDVNQRTEARFVAPLPVRFRDVRQTVARDAVTVEVDVGHRIHRPDVTVSGYAERTATTFAPIPVSDDQGADSVVCARGISEGTVVIRLVYREEQIVDERSLTILPPARHDPLAVAVEAFEAENDLLHAGLVGRDEDLFERSIFQLLVLAGYRTVWWGFNAKGKSMPREPVDAVAVSGDGTELMVIECTLEQAPDKKVRMLADRTKTMAKQLVARLGPNAPAVSSLLVVARSEASESLNRLLGEDRVGLMMRDDAVDLLAMVRRGEPRKALIGRVRDLCNSWTFWASSIDF